MPNPGVMIYQNQEEKWEDNMEEYKQHQFYSFTGDISPHIWEEICRDAKDKCYHWHVDHLPGMAREAIDMPFDEILKYLYTEKVHFVVIHRRGYTEPWNLEVGFSTLALGKVLPTTEIDVKGDLFLWINVDEEHIPYFIEKYKLSTK